MRQKVFTSGSFDPLHSGHVAFFEECAKLGDLYVGMGKDESITQYKHNVYQPQEERLYMVKALKCVKDASINPGMGFMDYITNPMFRECDILVINEGRLSERVRRLCNYMKKELVVMKRIHAEGLPERSSTEIRNYDTRKRLLDDKGRSGYTHL